MAKKSGGFEGQGRLVTRVYPGQLCLKTEGRPGRGARRAGVRDSLSVQCCSRPASAGQAPRASELKSHNQREAERGQ